jgi:hypothetical protein
MVMEIPEPAAFLFLGLGGLALLRKRRTSPCQLANDDSKEDKKGHKN